MEEEEGLQQFGSGLSAEKHGVHAWITTPCQLSPRKILLEVNLRGNAKFFPEQGKHMYHCSRLVVDIAAELSAKGQGRAAG